MIHWYYLLAIAVLLLVFLFYKEWKRRQRARLYGRLAASLLAVVCVLLLAYPFTENRTRALQQKLVLLTDGFVKDSVDNFIKEYNFNVQLYAGGPEHGYTARDVQPVADWKAFALRHTADTLHVFGNGFNQETLAMINPHPLVFHASPAPAAISAVYWKPAIETGGQLYVQGMYDNTGHQPVKIILQAFGTDKDTVTIAAGAHQVFELHTIPVHTGRAVYSLITLAGNDTLSNEPVPLETQTTHPLQLLIIGASPDFDNTYLKNHLSQKGYQVTVTTAVSSNKLDKQFLNMPAQYKAVTLTSSYLSLFDVLMADQEALQKMSTSELAAIRSAVQDKGMGLVIKLDARGTGHTFYSRLFPVKALPPAKESLLQLRSNVEDSNRYTIKVTEPAGIGAVTGSQILLQDAQSNSYASALLYGSGKIIGTTLQNTYSMALAGNQAAYQQLWRLLLNKAARKRNPAVSWRMHPAIPLVHQPVQMVLEDNALPVPFVMQDNTRIFLRQDALLPTGWHGMYWPGETGWHQWPGTADTAGSWYVYKPGDWQQLADHARRTATKKYMAAHPVSYTTEKPATNSRVVNWRLYVLAVFFACCIFLWVEQKMG